MLRLIGEQSGITVRRIGERLGVDATGLYRVVKRLIDDGRVRKDGTALSPAEPGTVLPAAPAAVAVSASQTPAEDGPQTGDAEGSGERKSATTAADTASSRES